jgi:hypothetical protein
LFPSPPPVTSALKKAALDYVYVAARDGVRENLQHAFGPGIKLSNNDIADVIFDKIAGAQVSAGAPPLQVIRNIVAQVAREEEGRQS